MILPPNIRKSNPNEAQALSELALRSKVYWGYSASFMQACHDELQVTKQLLTAPAFHYWVAERRSKLLGYYAVEKQSEQIFELEALFVEPEFIGQGVGKALIDHAKVQVIKLGGRQLIIQGDPNAEKFYRAAGGAVTGTRESASIPGRMLPLFTIDLTDNT